MNRSEQPPNTLEISRDGAQLFAATALSSLADLSTAFAHIPDDVPGTRLEKLSAHPNLFTADGVIGMIAASAIGCSARPVRALFFNKSERSNWGLGWHQDRTICVERRIDVTGFEPWTRKAGLLHVSPPYEILSRMVTVRVHLDDVTARNAPLLIAPGSHRLGRIAEEDIQAVVARCGTAQCLANAGDIWLYSTPILHASEAACEPRRRRVLQLDYAAFDLPHGLQWHRLI
ncbi:MAG TPA: phytanoyl-CoA dioxygenase family protein [Sphingomicrobium sp.]|nr:phytanoyl-CoA dioxygenase family protein [Sphingomicrobium sp.]